MRSQVRPAGARQPGDRHLEQVPVPRPDTVQVGVRVVAAQWVVLAVVFGLVTGLLTSLTPVSTHAAALAATAAAAGTLGIGVAMITVLRRRRVAKPPRRCLTAVSPPASSVP